MNQVKELVASIEKFTGVRFVFVGILNTFVGLSIIYLLKWLWDVSDVLANIGGYAIGFVLSFLLNREWTFRFRGKTVNVYAKFAVIMAIGYFINLVCVLIGLRMLNLNSYVSQALGLFPYSAFTYFALKHYVFVSEPTH